MKQASIAPELKLRHMFGLKPDVADNVHYLEENVVMYPVGRNLIIYDTETKQQRFIMAGDEKDESDSDITAIAVSPSKRTVAVAIQGAANGKIYIYDIRTLRLRVKLENPDVHSTTYTSIKFSQDGRYLLSMSGSPDYVLTTWHWESEEPLHSETINTKSTASKMSCSFNPYDPSIIVVTGYKLIIFLKIDHERKLQHIETKGKITENYLCHEWISTNKLVVGTESGKIVLFDNFALLKTLVTTADTAAVNCIKVCSRDKSFMLGTASGKIEMIQRQHKEDCLEDDYKKEKEFIVQQQAAAVNSLAVSAKGDQACISMENSQVFLLSLFNVEVLNPREMHFQPLGELGHHGKINGLDICLRKPMIVTCGTDNSVRVWDFQYKTLENKEYFPEEPLSVAFHPSGFHLVIGFADKLRFFNILMDSLKPIREFPLRGVKEVKFSNGGNLFAAAQNSVIHIFETYTCKKRPDLSIKYHNGKVSSIFWSEDDEAICSTGADGAVYLGKLGETSQRINEWQQKSCNFSCALASNNEKMYAVGKGNKIIEISGSSTTMEIEATKPLTQICIGHNPQRMFFAADVNGSIWSYKFPFASVYSMTYSCHSGAVTRMCISGDDKHLFSVSEDGTIAMWDISAAQFQGNGAQKESIPWSEEVMVSKSDLEEKYQEMESLEARVNVLILRNDTKLRKHDLEYEEALQDSTQKYQMKLEKQKSEYEQLKQAKRDALADHEDDINKLIKEGKETRDRIDQDQHRSLLAKVKEYEEKERYYDEKKREFVQDHKNMIMRHQDRMERMRRSHDQKYLYCVQEYKKAQKARDHVVRRFKETKRQLEIDTDKEIEDLKVKYESKLNAERDQKLRFKGENRIFEKRLVTLSKDILEQDEDIKKYAEQFDLLEKNVKARKDNIKSLKRQIQQLDDIISEKETLIYDLKKNIQELEKHKFVNDSKIKELNLEIEPREREIASMKNKVLEIDGELETLHRENRELEEEKRLLKKKLEERQKISKLKRQRLRKLESDLESIKKNIHIVAELVQHPERLETAVKSLCGKYAQVKESLHKVDSTIQGEYQAQENHLKETVKTLKKKLRVESQARRKNVVVVMRENMQLLKEIRTLRGNLGNLRQNMLEETAKQSHSRSHASYSVQEGYSETEASKIVQLQRKQIDGLRREIELARARLGIKVASGTVSKEKAQVA